MTIDIPAFTIPTIVFWPLVATVVGYVVGDRLLGQLVFAPLARRQEGTILPYSVWRFPYTFFGGPIIWFIVAKEALGKDGKRRRAEIRARREHRREQAAV